MKTSTALLPKPVPLESISLNHLSATIEPSAKLWDRIREAYEDDEDTSSLLKHCALQDGSYGEYSLIDGLLFFQNVIMIPDNNDIKRDILQHCHDDPLSGHFGVQKTHELVARTFTWPQLRQYVKRYVSTCETCLRNKGVQHRPYGLLQPLPVPKSPWSSISMDFITQLPPSDGHTAILVIVDRLTKMAHFLPTHNTVNAEETAELFLQRILPLHGLPDDVITDRGSTFTALFMRTLMKGLQVQQNMSTSFHPQSDGQTERTNATLEQYLRCYISYQQDNWSRILPFAEFSYNNTMHASTNQTPFYALLGYHPRFNVHLPRLVQGHPDALDRLERLTKVQQDLRFHIEYAHESQTRNYNRHVQAAPTFEAGDKVWLLRRNIKTTRPMDKLDYKRLGPFEIVKPVGTRAYRLLLPASMGRLHPVFHVSLLEPYGVSDIPGRTQPPPPPIEIDGEMEWEVEAILDSRRRRGQLQYLIHWRGYDESQRSWEPASNVENCPELLTDFHRRYPDKIGSVTEALAELAL